MWWLIRFYNSKLDLLFNQTNLQAGLDKVLTELPALFLKETQTLLGKSRKRFAIS